MTDYTVGANLRRLVAQQELANLIAYLEDARGREQFFNNAEHYVKVQAEIQQRIEDLLNVR